MKRFLWGLVCLTALPAVADLQADMINDRLDRLDREMTLMQKKVYTGEAVGGASDKPTDLNEVYAQLDEQNRAIAELTRRLEESVHAQELLQEQLNKLSAVATPDKKITEQKKEKVEQPSKKLTDKEAYDAAYDLLIKAKYAEAEKAFTTFLADYPDSKLVGNANYWLGETYYVRGQYEVAAGIFSDGLTKYEASSKAPDNLLKLGMTMVHLDKKTEACGFLTLLPEKFPKASETLKKRAEQEAKKLSCP